MNILLLFCTGMKQAKEADFKKIVMPRPAYGHWCIVCDSINRPGDGVTRVMGFHPANFELLGLSVLELGPGTRQTDRRTDRHRPSLHNAPSLRKSGHNKHLNLQ